MISSPGPGRPGSAAGPVEVLVAVRGSALTAAEALLQHVPDTGDHETGRAVDGFVEQAGDTLRALAESVAVTLGAAQDHDGRPDERTAGVAGGPGGPGVGARGRGGLPPGGWSS